MGRRRNMNYSNQLTAWDVECGPEPMQQLYFPCRSLRKPWPFLIASCHGMTLLRAHCHCVACFLPQKQGRLGMTATFSLLSYPDQKPSRLEGTGICTQRGELHWGTWISYSFYQLWQRGCRLQRERKKCGQWSKNVARCLCHTCQSHKYCFVTSLLVSRKHIQ